MIYHLINFLRTSYQLDIPYAFDYYSTRLCLAALTSLLFTIIVGPYFIKKLYELKIGQSIRIEECPLLAQLHEKKQDTPTMGGILILFSILLSLLLWMNLTSPYTLILLFTTLYLGALGAYDDYLKLKYRNAKGLSGKKKFAFQAIFALFLGLYLITPMGESKNHTTSYSMEQISKADSQQVLSHQYASLYIPFFKDPIRVFTGIGVILFLVLVIVVICGTSNAVNLTDGLDGLAAGNIIMVSATLALVAFISNHQSLSDYLNVLYLEGSGEIAIFLAALSGGCLGFLWYNGHPAQVFMGDTGSLALGGLIGVSAVLLRREFFLALIGGVFVLEALSVILQVMSYKYRNKKRIFLCAPIHHHFEYKGWSESKVVVRFWILGLLFSLIGIASLKLQ